MPLVTLHEKEELFLQKIRNVPQVAQKDFGASLPIFICPGPEDGRRMHGSNDGWKTFSLLHLSMRLRDPEVWAQQRLRSGRSEADN